MFYSRIDAWQRKLGYCRLYDEAAAPFGIIMDCEPIYFNYGGNQWLIEFWKGQYDLTTGCEMGIYKSKGDKINIPGVYKGTFYESISNDELMQMSFSLIKNGRILFERSDRHWWLTGFRLGEFSEPSELIMNLSIKFDDIAMGNEFIKGLINAGYTESEILINDNIVGLKFDKPRTKQPISRTPKTDLLIQMKNKMMYDTYNKITKPYDNLLDKINAVKLQAPELYKEIFNIGKTRQMFKKYRKLSRYLN